MKKIIFLFMAFAFVLTSCAQRTYQSYRYSQHHPHFSRVVKTPETESNVLVEHTNVINYYHQTKEEVHHYFIDDACPQSFSRQSINNNYAPYTDDVYEPYTDMEFNQSENKWFFFFDFNSYNIKNKEELGHLIDFAKAHPGVKFYIDSYGDIEYGSYSENYLVSKKRSTVVAKYMLREGVRGNAIFVSNNGCNSQPYNTNSLNRCVIVRAVF